MENINQVFIRNLDILMEDKKINDKTLEKEIKVTNGTVSKWRNRGSLPRADILINIAKLFNVSLDRLFSEEFTSNVNRNNEFNTKAKSINFSTQYDSPINNPLNKYVDWRLVKKYSFDATDIADLIPNFDFKYAEGYVYFDKDANIEYYLICIYKVDPYDKERELFYFAYNRAYLPQPKPMDEFTLNEMFNYFHNKNIIEAGKEFYDKKVR